MEDSKNILIFGATGGIGRALVNKLATTHHHLILVGRNQGQLEEILHEIKYAGCTASQLCIDLGKEFSYVNACDILIKSDTRIDWIVHSAGHLEKEASLSSEEKKSSVRKTLEINFIAPFLITQSLSSKVREGVIFITSTASLNGNGFFPAYAASKGALTTFAKSLSLSWQETKKRSVIVCPGPTQTEMRERVLQDSALHQSPEEIADLVLKIFADEKTYSNGSHLLIKDSQVTVL